MKTDFVKKSYSLGLLSLFGYVVFSVLFLIVVCNFDTKYNEGLTYSFMALDLFLANTRKVFLEIQAGLVILLVVELILNKSKKLPKNGLTVPAVLVKLYPYLLWIGISFALIFLSILLLPLY